MTPRTLFENTWTPHLVADLGEGYALLHVDRNLLHDLSGARGLDEVARRGLAIHSPQLAFSVPDHAGATRP
ncbi:MAG: 3-isopropylmalate dehydratase, partial [Proteobacteria bacterium]|nr:3-isopropylmalate dehydratase [Pseudomonadota bacterium]